MNKQLFEKLLPEHGVICVASITPKSVGADGKTKEGVIVPRFAEGLDDALKLMENFVAQGGVNVYFTPCTFHNKQRKAQYAHSAKSFYLDLEFEHGKDGQKYDTEQELFDDLHRFCGEIDWPFPTLVKSGGGIHAYWIFNEAVDIDIWQPYAEKFKQLCLDHNLKIDEGVPADAARLLRVPSSYNYRYDPPRQAELLTDSDKIETYSFQDLIGILGVVEQSFDLGSVEKGLDEETQAIYDKLNGNYEYSFSKIAEASLKGYGCGQIKKILTEAADCPEPLWYAGLSVAVRCADGATAIHLLSEDYPEYSSDETERKAAQSLAEATWAHSCTAFNSVNAGGCEGCQHRGKLGKSGPIALGRTIKIAFEGDESAGDSDPATPEDEADSVRQGKPLLVFPDFLKPFTRPVNGGVYYQSPPHQDTKTGKWTQDDPMMITPNDLYAYDRLYSPLDGECLAMRLQLPRDAVREFLLPLKDVSALDRLKSALASNGVVFEIAHAPRLASYLMRWASYLMNIKEADIMRMQMGWTEGHKSFVIGKQEVLANEIRNCPPSPVARNVTRELHAKGEYETWRDRAQMLNNPGFEIHAFTMLVGFAATLVEFSSVRGVCLALCGPTGTAKTGALYGAMSIWGNPEQLSLNDGTDNALVQRLVTLKNIPFGLDEQGNSDGKRLSDLIHKVSAGRPKLRMQSSTNQEREAEFNTGTVGIFTTNHDLVYLMEMFKSDVAAEEMRLLSLTTVNNWGPDGIPAELGKLMFNDYKYHYGHAGPMFVQRLLQLGPENVRKRIDDKFRESVHLVANGSGEFRFHAALRTLTIVCNDIIGEMGMLHYDMDRILVPVDKQISTLAKARRAKTDTSGEDILGDFIAKNVANTLVLNDSRVSMSPRGPLCVRAEVDTGLVYVSVSAMKEYLAPRRMGSREFESRLQQSGILKGKVKKAMAAGWQDAIGAVNIWAYLIEFDINLLLHVEELKALSEPTV